MSEIVSVQIGQSLPPERWALAFQRLAPLFAKLPEAFPEDKEAADSLREDLQLALIAIGYVATCASENCRFINVDGLPHKGGQQE